jgi:hypothetical protein
MLQNIYKGFQDFAKIHGEKHLLETMSLTRAEDEWAESRPYLRSMLKTPDTSPDPLWEIIVESAIFLELARELDERDIEVDNDLFAVRDLEDQFKTALGLETEDDFEEVEESVRVVTEELPRRSYFGYLTKTRVVRWLRTYFAKLPYNIRRCSIEQETVRTVGNDLPILLCISRDVMEELIDPVRTREERGGFDWSPEVINILEVPNIFEGMNDDRFYDLSSSIANEMVDLWSALQDYINRRDNRKVLLDTASFISDRFRSITAGETPVIPSKFRLSVVFHPSFNILKAWQIIDSSAYKLLESVGLPDPDSLPMLVFEELSAKQELG